MGLNLGVILSACCCLRPSLPPTQEGDPMRSDHPIRGAHKPNDANLNLTPQNVNQSTPPPSNILSAQAPGQQTMALTTIDPEKVKDGNLQISSQATVGANGFFNGASHFILNQPVMNYINEAKDNILQQLAKFTMSGTEFDACGHVPGCYPGTRIKILEVLQRQVGGSQRVCRMMWLRGPAGVGKSAILQSLAERLSETPNLGATLFFSRPNGRHNPDFVIPTVAYQLAVRIPPYKEYIKQVMINNPKLLEKDMERQFQALIIEPFTKLGLAAEGGRWVILLDGLDECQGESAQILIVKLISRFIRQHPTAPLVWVIASRPEAHLQVVFDSEEVKGSFKEQEVLANSDDACRDVEEFLRTKFGEIRQNYKDLIPLDVPWPAEQDITRVSDTSSGLFALAATIIHCVGDPDACDPISQLTTILSVTRGLEPGSLATLYTLYSTILASVPKTLSPILKLVLAFYTTLGRDSSEITDNASDTDDYPLVLFATIFGLQQHAVYGALRKLHSVIKVPPLRESGRLGIKFYHASFPDYLKTLKDYTVDVGVMREMWWGWFAILHGGDSTAYRDATSNGRFRVPLSWSVELINITPEDLWRAGLRILLHLLLPECLFHDDERANHIHLSPNTKELQNVLEKFDFSSLIFRWQDRQYILEDLFYLFKWLVRIVPLEPPRSGVVKIVSMRDLNLACIPEAKPSYGAKWLHRWNGVTAIYITSYATVPSQPPDQYFGDQIFPTHLLISELSVLQSENPMMDVLVVGERPSRRCVLICAQSADPETELFYYVPYHE